MAEDVSSAPGRRDALIQACWRLIADWHRQHSEQFFSQSKDALIERADNAHTNAEQNALLLCQKELERRQAPIRQALGQWLERCWKSWQQNQAVAVREITTPEGQLTLVGKEEQEEDLLVIGLNRRISHQLGDEHYALGQRLGVLSGHPQQEQQIPIDPALLTEGCRQLVERMTGDKRTRLLLLNLLGKYYLSDLDTLYQTLNQMLIQAGILPTLSYQIHKQASSARPASQTTTPATAPVATTAAGETSAPPTAITTSATANSTAEAMPEQQQALMQAIQGMLQNARGGTPVGHPPPQQIAPLIEHLQGNQEQQLGQLNQLSSQAQASQVNLSDMRQHIHRRPTGADEKTEHLIELVGMLFDCILDDKHLPDSIKAVLGYLHTPMLKVALQDAEFFEHPQHPARLLLNSLVEAGLRWVEPDSRRSNEVFLQIKAVVEKVLREHDKDARLFSKLAFEFHHYLRQYQLRAERAEERARQAAEGEDRLRQIRQNTQDLLQQRIAKRDVPSPVEQLLREAWANYMVFNELRHGRDSNPWKEALILSEQLLEQVQAGQGLSRILLDRIRKGLETIGFDSQRGDQLLRAVSAACSGLPTEPIDVAPSTPTPPAKPEEPLSTKDLEALRQLQFGSWFRLPDPSHPVAKLAWFNQRTSNYMFVNRLGQQVAVLSGHQLLSGLRSGQIEPMQSDDKRPFFERALERIFKQLRGRRSQSHNPFKEDLDDTASKP